MESGPNITGGFGITSFEQYLELLEWVGSSLHANPNDDRWALIASILISHAPEWLECQGIKVSDHTALEDARHRAQLRLNSSRELLALASIAFTAQHFRRGGLPSQFILFHAPAWTTRTFIIPSTPDVRQEARPTTPASSEVIGVAVGDRYVRVDDLVRICIDQLKSWAGLVTDGGS